MITAARLRDCATRDGVIALLRDLGYPVQPIDIRAEAWRSAGVDTPFDSLALAARIPRLDCYVVDDAKNDDDVARFLKSLHAWNVITKSVAICRTPQRLSLYDLGARRELRRLDVDLAAPSPHAIDRLNVLQVNGSHDAARLFDRALDRETLTKQFFDRFRSAVRDVAAELRRTIDGEKKEAIDGEALLILSRILFLYFIQQKGWLAGERRFLADRLDAAVCAKRELFATVLMSLFFGCLNTPREARSAAAQKLGAVPYLNGGLFEPSAFERRHEALHLSNELMSRVIDDVFEKFAFSIDESDAAGTHIDPEMLGKVFESLMASGERAASGSFYTPRAIVDVLAERAIVESLSDGDSRVAALLRSRLQGEDVALPPDIEERRTKIVILDPACGSGAFLLSALRVLERLGARDRKGIVEHNLFGVDLKPEAVRLCELRLWLAIVSKSDQPIESVQPLPNLDRNILQGNSLLTPIDFLGDGRGDVYREWVTTLHAHDDVVARYRSAPAAERPALARLIRTNDCRLATALLQKAIGADERELHELSIPQRDLFGRSRILNGERCRELQERIAAARRVQQRADEGELDFFSFDVHFAPIMARGGFDAVIGNPPWVRNSRIDARSKRMLAERYRLFRAARDARAAFHQPDLSIAFFERSLALARKRGVVSLLMPAKLLNAAYAAPLRRAAEPLDVVALHDWSGEKWFEADTFPLGITIAKRSGAKPPTAPSGEWMLLPPDVAPIVARLQRAHGTLVEALGRTPLMGVKSGDNGAFFLDVKRLRGKALELHDGMHIPLTAVCRCVRGRDVRRWSAVASEWMLWPPRDGWRTPPQWLERFAASRKLRASDLRLAYVRPEHAGVKVVWKDLSRGLSAAVLADSVRIGKRRVPLIPNQTLYVLDATSIDEAHFLAAMLNSTVFGALALCTAERAKDSHFRYFGRTIARVPFPRVPVDVVAHLTQLGREFGVRRQGRRFGIEAKADEIDTVVANLYGVSDEELALLQKFVAERLGHAV